VLQSSSLHADRPIQRTGKWCKICSLNAAWLSAIDPTWPRDLSSLMMTMLWLFCERRMASSSPAARTFIRRTNGKPDVIDQMWPVRWRTRRREFEWLAVALKREIPILGICRGMQLHQCRIRWNIDPRHTFRDSFTLTHRDPDKDVWHDVSLEKDSSLSSFIGFDSWSDEQCPSSSNWQAGVGIANNRAVRRRNHRSMWRLQYYLRPMAPEADAHRIALIKKYRREYSWRQWKRISDRQNRWWEEILIIGFLKAWIPLFDVCMISACFGLLRSRSYTSAFWAFWSVGHRFNQMNIFLG